MNLLDLAILALMLVFLIRGFKRGLINEIFQILGLAAAFLFTSPVTKIVSQFVKDYNKDIDPDIIFFGSGIVSFIVIILIFLVIGKVFTGKSNDIVISLPNKF